jgi:vancomycin resistance protein VanJ
MVPGFPISSQAPICSPAGRESDADAPRDDVARSSARGRGFVIRPEVFDHVADAVEAPPRRWLSKTVAICTWGYVAAVLAVWLLLWLCGDRWWFATVLLFGPRWPYAAPWLLFAPLAALVRRRLLWPLTAAAVVLLGPVMGLCLPWARLAAHDGPTVRVLTCNVDGTNVDIRRLMALVAAVQPDMVALQECPQELATGWPAGWHVVRSGQLLVASPHPLRGEQTATSRHPPSPWPPVNGLWCTLEMPQGRVGFCCIHLSSPRYGISEVLDHRTLVSAARSAHLTAGIADRGQESAELADWLSNKSGCWVAAGDFNMPTDSAIYRAGWGRYVNTFSASGFGFGYTKWTEIRGWQFGARIDHVLGGPGLTARRSWVGPDVGSDHLPLLAELALPSPD